MNPIDHRNIAKQQDLFHFQDEAPGMVFWHRRGFAIYAELEAAARRQLARGGYGEVRTPQILRRSIWESSGHLAHFEEGMFAISSASDNVGAAMKPVSCPGHIQIFKNARPSWRDLPFRLAEFGLVHRNEASGNLHGLFRLRQFTQDDGHVFCAREQVLEEVQAFCAQVQPFYLTFGFDKIEVKISGRPPGRFGPDELWDEAENILDRAARGAGMVPEFVPGQGAFYGPKIEFVLQDREGRSWQCGTIQLDFVLPERFGAVYIDASGDKVHPVMLHRALFGSVERFLGVLLEHHEGKLPAWLAPDQIHVLPLSEPWAEAAAKVHQDMLQRGLRARLDARSLSVGRRVAEARRLALPFIVVVGPSEVEKGVLSLEIDDQRVELAHEQALDALEGECSAPRVTHAS